jgi:hypothetical protein
MRNHPSFSDKQEILGFTEDCLQGLLPLFVPLSLHSIS